ncbi:tRNA 2-thiouridine(34) synthase MnmA [Oribacterium sp. WCC10]|uniref:tRNA 2-thiouridine(34) synthase MnmA n=1 Tax=Oribacterium sp. WCC10 TaxID=1855343 RepID=UPI0008E48239|nr:tRNA 2-thiouridine(34) synthase MnmA [Oribacterium sp. WCC10]SFG40462.1 tRNA-specific 2-thiouridylase [Oribacterium sp. WCC10]
MSEKKALIAMSGGVDSSVAAALMCEAGFDCIGVTMKLYDRDSSANCRDNTCCTLEDTEDARQVADSLDMPYYVFNFTEDFDRQVIERFVKTYQAGGTPNPCIECNRYMKHEKLYHKAKDLNCDFIVTGHYARIEQDPGTGRWLLKKSRNISKDQSYVLYFMNQEQLAHTKFPLGDFASKDEVRAEAEKHGFINAHKHDSQDICFVDGDYGDFIEDYTGETFEPGNFVDTEGNVLGQHKGIIRYTVGQRKGLGLALKQPMYVCDKDMEKNEVILTVGPELYSKALIAEDFNWIPFDTPKEPVKVTVKTRYKAKEVPATAEVLRDKNGIATGQVKITFDTPERAVAIGQAVVLYDGDVVVGGGTIVKSIK